MKREYKHILFSAPLMLSIALIFSGCAAKTIPSEEKHDSFTSVFSNITDTAYYFCSLDNQTTVLDYETMKTLPLCNRPNCKHDKNDCISHRLKGNIPLISGTSLYYFIDTGNYMTQGDDGKPYLELGSTLYRFDLMTNQEEKLYHIDGVSVSHQISYGSLLHDGTIYFIGNHFNPEYDETGMICGYGSSGGRMELFALNLSDLTIQSYGDLYHIDALSKIYPYARNSGEVYMKGLFENRFYFEVCFVPDDNIHTNYVRYVTWFDLDTKTYHGEPQDYSNIDFCNADFVSKDYLVLTREKQADVYKAGQAEPIILKDDCFQLPCYLSVFDDTLYYDGKAFDLKSGKGRTLEDIFHKQVIAKYGDSYIVSDIGMKDNFEKIPAEQLLK